MYSKVELNKRHRKKKYLQHLALSCPESYRPLADLPYGWTQELYADRLGRLLASRSAFGRSQSLQNSAGYSLINSIIELIKHTNYSAKDKVRICFNMTAILINSCELPSSRLKSWAELTTNYNFTEQDVEHLGSILHDKLTPALNKKLAKQLWDSIKADQRLFTEIQNYLSDTGPEETIFE